MKKIYISNLRNIATFSVVFLHVSGQFLRKYGNIDMTSWKLANLFDSSVRFCVPIFLMIMGALILNNNDSFKDFIFKRIKRIIIPLIFWSIIYFILSNIDVMIHRDYSKLLTEFVKAVLYGQVFIFGTCMQ